MDAKYFPLNYHDSRKKFKDLATAAGADLSELKIPSTSDNDLYVDFAYLPPRTQPEFLLVLTSGIHGSETYAGTAILNLFFAEILPKLDREHTGIFLAHAMNPYGFKHHQRTTENGVNLNRNFSVSGDLFKSKSLESETMNQQFLSKEIVDSNKSKLLQLLKYKNGVVYFEDVSLDQLTKAISPGQFNTKEHLEYGGKQLEPQTRFLIDKMKTLFPLYKDILGLDLHTGLGDKNRLHLLTSGSTKELNPELFQKLFHQKEDSKYYVYTPPTEEGFYDVHGALNSMFSDLADNQQRVCSLTMEFGTMGHSIGAQLEGWNSSILAHQGRMYGFKTKELEDSILQAAFERSYPQTDEWREAVIKASRGLLTRVLQRLVEVP